MTGRSDRSILWWVYATLRTLYCWVALALLTLVVGTLYLLTGWWLPSNGRFIRFLERAWVTTILEASFVDLSVRGLEHARPGESYIVMANHASMYDIPAVHYLLGADRDLRWIGKKELVKVPIFGWVFALSRHIPIDRHHRERGIAAMKQAAAESEEGCSFVVMPEGTRSRDGRLLPFKKGGFHLAIDTGLPILPTAIVGSQKLMRKGEWWILPGSIEVVVTAPVPVEGLDKSDVESLRDRVRERIGETLEEARRSD
ncbi:MAG: lysophospholipid acyltransferase family protein [Gemmatimonadota bacterium]|nr:lysophospholipid acyltransferase family protein [Gemmatimonadota bacterium]